MLHNLILKTKIIFKKTNPFKIKTQHTYLKYNQITPNSQSNIHKQKSIFFHQYTQLNHDSFIFRFHLSQQNKCLGHQIGQYVQLRFKGQSITKPYVPISRIDDAGFVDFLIKKLKNQNINSGHSQKKQLNLFSQRLFKLKKDEQIEIQGPFVQNFIYEGYGKFQSNKLFLNPTNFRYVGLIAHGTALASFFSLIQSIGTNHDSTSISLIWVAPQERDFCLLEQLNWFVQQRKLNLNLIIENKNNEGNWLGPVAPLNAVHINNFLPFPREDSIILISGPRNFLETTRKLTQSVGHKNIIA